MTSALLAMSLLLLAGLPLAAWLEPSLGVRARTGVAFLLGSGVVILVMFFATLAGLDWSRWFVVGSVACVAVAALPFALRRPKQQPAAARRTLVVAVVADIATLVSVAGYARIATVTRPWEWDFWAIWGLKGKAFFLARGVSLEYLSRPDNYCAHPDYPPLLPLVYDVIALIQGRWDDRWMGVVSVAFAIAMLLVLREELERQSESAVVGALGTLALSGAACSPWVGLGEAPLLAFATIGLVLLSRGLRDDSIRAIATGSLLVGFAALTKNEGVSFAAAMMAMSLVVARRRWPWFVFPALLVAAPWLVARMVESTATDVFEGGFGARFVERLSDPMAFFGTVASGHFERFPFWLLLGLILAICPAVVRRELFLLGVIELQALAYLAVYAGTHNELGWHIRTSLARVSSHLAPIVGIVAVLGIGQMLRSAPKPVPEREDEVGPEA